MAGRRPETGTDAVLAVFHDRADRAEPLKADEVDAQMDCSKRTTLRRLDELADDGPLESKEVGARARVWWLPIPRDKMDTDADSDGSDSGGDDDE